MEKLELWRVDYFKVKYKVPIEHLGNDIKLLFANSIDYPI